MPGFADAARNIRPAENLLAPFRFRRKVFQPLHMRVGIGDHVVQIDHSLHVTTSEFKAERYTMAVRWPTGHAGKPLTADDAPGLTPEQLGEPLDSGVLVRFAIDYDCTFEFKGHNVFMTSDDDGRPTAAKDVISEPSKPKRVQFKAGTGSQKPEWLLMVDTFQGIKTFASITQTAPQAQTSIRDRLRR